MKRKLTLDCLQGSYKLFLSVTQLKLVYPMCLEDANNGCYKNDCCLSLFRMSAIYVQSAMVC